MTAVEMATALRGNLGNRSTTDVPDATSVWWFNWTMLHLASPRVYRHRELETSRSQTLVDGTSLYTIASSGTPIAVNSVVIVHSTDTQRRQRLWPVRSRDAFDISGVMSNSEPTWYSWWGATQIEVLPAPNSVYANWNLIIRYIQPPTMFAAANLSAGSVTSSFSPLWDEAIVQGATWRGWRWLKEWERAEQAKGEFGQLVNEIASRHDTEAEDIDFGPQVVMQEVM